MQEALAMHKMMLQREATKKWLQVGLWRREQRLEVAIKSSVEDTANTLKFIEPFARRWKQKAQEAKREG